MSVFRLSVKRRATSVPDRGALGCSALLGERLLNRDAPVVEADKVAQANLIRRREETAATRSLLNTAKVMENNPVLLRLKELEALERVTEKVDSLTVYGGLEGLMKGLVRIEAPRG